MRKGQEQSEVNQDLKKSVKKTVIIQEPKNLEVVSSSDDKFSVMERAEAVQTYLGNKFPTCVKSMLPSHVSSGFWLGFPKNFSNLHLPSHDAIVILEDEIGEVYETVYLCERHGLSGGWKRFAIRHDLLERDTVVFELVQPCKFKVYIVRANCISQIDGALGLMDIAHAATNRFGVKGHVSIASKSKQTKRSRNDEATLEPRCEKPKMRSLKYVLSELEEEANSFDGSDASLN